MHYNIIGAGRLGKNIVAALSEDRQFILNSICNSSFNSAQQVCLDLGKGVPVAQIAELPFADLTWITCNDDSINEVVSQLIVKPKSLIVHCSGVLSSALLAPLKAQGCKVASIHPLKSFRLGAIDKEAFFKVDCVVEGDSEACDWLRSTFTVLGANIIQIKPQAKASYHAGAAMACNYLITLAAASDTLLAKTGLDIQQRHSMLCNLMQTTLDNLKHSTDISEALTGPLMRGDVATLHLHLQAIDNPIIKQFYQAAGLATLGLTALNPAKHEIIERLMSGVSRET